MKRFTRYVFLILALVIVFMVTVSADDLDNTGSWINVLDYATLNNSGSNYISFSNSVTVSFDTDIKSIVRFVDIVVNTAGADISAASINGNALTVIGLDSQVFRIYGSVGNITTGKYDLTLSASGTCYLDFMQFHVNGQYRLMYDEIGTLSVGSKSYTMSSSASSVTHLFSGDSYSAFTSNVYCSNWKEFDFLDFYITCFVEGIDSISARFNGLDVPISVSYLGGSNGVASGESNNKIMIRMDVRGLDRTIVNYPFIEISGVCDGGNNNQIVLVKVAGSIVSNSVNPVYIYFRELGNRIESFFASMADRQDAYHSDLQEWQQAHDQLLSDKFALVNSRLSGISSAIVSMMNTLKVSIDTAGINVVDKLTSFQSSMENYLDQLPARIAEEIAKIFKPTEGKFEAAKDESQELAEEKLGAVYQSAVVIDQIASAFTVQTPQTSIMIPLVSVEVLPGVPFQFGGWDVPIVPAGLEFLIDTLKYVIDIVCTLAFLNGMKRRLDGFFGGESGVD